MKKKFLSAAVAVILAGPAFADDACDTASIEAKSVELATAMQQFAIENPTEAQEILIQFQTEMQAAVVAEDEAAACAAIDAILEAMS